MLARRDGGEQAEPFRPPRTGPARAVAHPTNLPLQLTSFVGRERQLDDVGGLLARRRLVTLTGAGGSGKTRLALEVAKRFLPEFEDGVWLVELGSLSDAAQVAQATAVAVGAESRSRRPSEESIADHIGQRSFLIVLDNCEHLVGACASLAGTLLTRCPELKVLATSREPLGLQGEVDARVPSLTLPAPDFEFSVGELRGFESVRLFTERAAAAAPQFELTEATGRGVADICRRVDGMPLALELAAARVAVLSVDEIAERLRGSLSLLAGGGRNALSRQQTLTATIDWSHDLLGESERALFRRLGVFAGSVSLAAVEEVCAGDPIAPAEVLDLLGALVSKSLVLSERSARESRFRLLVPLRQYARERLEEAGERELLEAHHRRHFVELGEAIEPGLVAVDPAPALARLDLEYDDLRIALRRALASDPGRALRLATSLWRYWLARSRFAEGGEWLRAALERTTEPSSSRTRALVGACILGIRQGENVAGPEALTESVEVGRAAGDDLASAEALQLVGALDFIYQPASEGPGRLDRSRELAVSLASRSLLASALQTLAVRADFRGDRPRALELLGESLALLRRLPEEEPLTLPVVLAILVTPEGPGGSPRVFLEETLVQARRVRAPQAVGDVLVTLGSVHRNAGQPEAARERLDDAVARFRDVGDTVGTAIALGQLGNLLRLTGDHETARELLEECLALREQIGDRRGVGLALGNLGLLAARTGDSGRARELLARARKGFLAAGDKPGEAHVEMNLGHVATDEGEFGEARAQLERAKRIWSDFLDIERVAAWLDVCLVAISGQQGDEERARRHLAQALAVFQSTRDAAGTAWCERQAVAVEGPC
jgi:predicted ATPase